MLLFREGAVINLKMIFDLTYLMYLHSHSSLMNCGNQQFKLLLVLYGTCGEKLLDNERAIYC